MPLAGSAKDCFANWVQAKGRSEVTAALVARGIKRKTAAVWFTKDLFPKGKLYLMLMHVMREQGYAVSELQVLLQPVFELGKLIAEDVVTLPEAAAAIGYGKPGYMYKHLLNQRPISEKFLDRITRFVAERESGHEAMQKPLPIRRSEPPPRGAKDVEQKVSSALTDMMPPAAQKSVSREVIDHAITQFNSLARLVARFEYRDAPIYDSDRQQITSAMQNICRTLGINVSFGDISLVSSEPATSVELAGVTHNRRTRIT